MDRTSQMYYGTSNGWPSYAGNLSVDDLRARDAIQKASRGAYGSGLTQAELEHTTGIRYDRSGQVLNHLQNEGHIKKKGSKFKTRK